MSIITIITGDTARSSPTPAHHNLETLEIALSEEEIANATILEFDPEASVSFCPRPPLGDDGPAFHAVPGHYYSLATWSRLAVGALGGRPSDALARFLRLRARDPD